MELTPAVLDLGISSAPERTIIDILAGIRKPEFETIRQIIEALRICIHELCIDEKGYAVSVQKNMLAKLIMLSEINGMELDTLVHTILEHGFYE